LRVLLVSSQAITSVSLRTLRARRVMSSMFPMGVATTNSFPAKGEIITVAGDQLPVISL